MASHSLLSRESTKKGLLTLLNNEGLLTVLNNEYPYSDKKNLTPTKLILFKDVKNVASKISTDGEEKTEANLDLALHL